MFCNERLIVIVIVKELVCDVHYMVPCSFEHCTSAIVGVSNRSGTVPQITFTIIFKACISYTMKETSVILMGNAFMVNC